MIGSATEDWTSATMSALGAREVISHAAPTDWIIEPKLDAILASQIARNTGWRSDAKMDSPPARCWIVEGLAGSSALNVGVTPRVAA